VCVFENDSQQNMSFSSIQIVKKPKRKRVQDDNVSASVPTAGDSDTNKATNDTTQVASADVEMSGVNDTVSEKQDSSSTAAADVLTEPEEKPQLSFVYVPGGAIPDLDEKKHKLIEILIPARYLSTRNKEVQTRQLWGTDAYTDDSDAVASK
jgi:Histone deacetylation protein Rxt3